MRALFFFLICITFNSFGQTKNCIDYLEGLKQSLGANPDSIYNLAQEIIDSKKESPKCKSVAFNIQVISTIYSGDYEAGIKAAEKGEAFALKNGEDSICGRILAMKGVIYDYQGNYSIAKSTYSKAGEIFLKMKDTLNYGDSFNNVGLMFYYNEQLDSAYTYLSKAATIFESETQDSLNKAFFLSAAYLNLGNISYREGKYLLANKSFFQTLHYGEELKDMSLQIAALNNISGVYEELNNHKEALHFINQSIKLSIGFDSPSGQGLTLYKKGNILQSIQEYDSALIYYAKSKEQYLKAQKPRDVAMIDGAIGSVYMDRNESDKALPILIKAANDRKLLEDDYGYWVTCQNVAKTYFNLKNYSKAEEFAKIVQLNILPIDDYGLFLDNTYLLMEINQNTGRHAKALEFALIYSKAKDSSFTADFGKQHSEMNALYDLGKKEKHILLLNKEKELQEAQMTTEKALGEKQKMEIATQKRQNIYLFVGLGLVALFGFFMFNRFKVTQKQKLIIEDQKQEVEKQKITVEHTLKELETTHEQLEESHKEITDSINYAERIQRSFLATKETLDEHLKDYFVFFKPKEAVSGDFYWAAQLNNNNFAFTVADSTGHGVPGAIMSLLNITSLERSVETEVEPHSILNKTREIIVNRLKKDGSEHGGKDGMDCNLMVLNQDKSVLSFASANNTIVIIRQGEILEFKGDKTPV